MCREKFMSSFRWADLFMMVWHAIGRRSMMEEEDCRRNAKQSVRLFLIVRRYEYELDIFGLAAHPRIGYSSHWWKSVADVPYRSRIRTWSIWSVHHTSWSVHHTRVLISPSVAPVISCSIIIISHAGLTQQHQKRFKSIQINRCLRH